MDLNNIMFNKVWKVDDEVMTVLRGFFDCVLSSIGFLICYVICL